jgi:hypothetical protein
MKERLAVLGPASCGEPLTQLSGNFRKIRINQLFAILCDEVWVLQIFFVYMDVIYT